MKKIKNVIALIFVCVLSFMLSVNGVENEPTARPTEYERAGSCNFTQGCVYRFSTAQYSFGEEEREKLFFSADVHWHCESSGLFGAQPANEYCFTLFNSNVISSAGFDLNDTANYTTNGQQPNDTIAVFLEDELKGEFCYVQTNDGKVVSVHFSPTENHESLNIKKGIAAIFQANFDNAEEIKESDPGSTHISHYRYSKTSSKVVSFTRSITAKDLIDVSGNVPNNSLDYTKQEESTFVNKVLYSSHGVLKARVDYSKKTSSEPPASDTFNPNFHFDKEFDVNGTYTLRRKYCKQRQRRSFIFADLTSYKVQKGTLKAIMNEANMDQQRIHKIRKSLPSIAGFLEELRKNPNKTQLVHTFQHLLSLEAKYGPPPQSTATIEQIADYYKQIRLSNKPQDAVIRKILYSFFSIDGSVVSQKILASSLLQKLEDDEKSVLLHQLMQLNNVSLSLVNTILNINPSNDDSIILVLGVLARNSNVTTQKVVVDELLRRLSVAVTSKNNTETLITLTYALGNSGSKLPVHALLSSLQHDDIDVQISAIRSLGYHLDQQIVQEAFMISLALTDEDKVLEEILMSLLDAFDSAILTNPSKEFLDATVNCTIKLKNPNLYELLANYLQKIDIKDVEVYLNLLKQQHNYGEVDRDQISDINGIDSRVKRGSDWDQYYSGYDVVASYYQRRNDVINYPNHKAYIWGKTYGVDKLNLKIGAGAFIGAYCQSNANKRFKVFAKGAAKVEVFGRNYNLAHLEYSDHTSGNYLYHKVYVKLGSSVLKNTYRSEYIHSCKSNDITLWNSGAYTVFNLRFSIWVFVGTISVYVRGSVSSRGDLGICTCPSKLSACGSVKPSLSLTVSGGASASLLFLVRGGIEVSATVTYYLKPELCVEGLSGSSCGVSTCLSLYHGLPNSYIDIYPWYQTRTFKRWRLTWGKKRRWNALSRKWSIRGSNSLLWRSCPTTIYPQCY